MATVHGNSLSRYAPTLRSELAEQHSRRSQRRYQLVEQHSCWAKRQPLLHPQVGILAGHDLFSMCVSLSLSLSLSLTLSLATEMCQHWGVSSMFMEILPFTRGGSSATPIILGGPGRRLGGASALASALPRRSKHMYMSIDIWRFLVSYASLSIFISHHSFPLTYPRRLEVLVGVEL